MGPTSVTHVKQILTLLAKGSHIQAQAYASSNYSDPVCSKILTIFDEAESESVSGRAGRIHARVIQLVSPKPSVPTLPAAPARVLAAAAPAPARAPAVAPAPAPAPARAAAAAPAPAAARAAGVLDPKVATMVAFINDIASPVFQHFSEKKPTESHAIAPYGLARGLGIAGECMGPADQESVLQAFGYNKPAEGDRKNASAEKVGYAVVSQVFSELSHLLNMSKVGPVRFLVNANAVALRNCKISHIMQTTLIERYSAKIFSESEGKAMGTWLTDHIPDAALRAKAAQGVGDPFEGIPSDEPAVVINTFFAFLNVWQEKFSRSTIVDDYYGLDGNVYDAQIMALKKPVRTYTDFEAGCTIIRKAFRVDSLEEAEQHDMMYIIIVPHDSERIIDFEKMIKGLIDIAGNNELMPAKTVRLRIPRLNTGSIREKLTEALDGTRFPMKAELSQLGKGIRIQVVHQDNYFKVNEEGAEGYSNTSVSGFRSAAPVIIPIAVDCNRPYISCVVASGKSVRNVVQAAITNKDGKFLDDKGQSAPFGYAVAKQEDAIAKTLADESEKKQWDILQDSVKAHIGNKKPVSLHTIKVGPHTYKILSYSQRHEVTLNRAGELLLRDLTNPRSKGSYVMGIIKEDEGMIAKPLSFSRANRNMILFDNRDGDPCLVEVNVARASAPECFYRLSNDYERTWTFPIKMIADRLPQNNAEYQKVFAQTALACREALIYAG